MCSIIILLMNYFDLYWMLFSRDGGFFPGGLFSGRLFSGEREGFFPGELFPYRVPLMSEFWMLEDITGVWLTDRCDPAVKD